MTLTKDKAVQIFANLIKDPYFQKTKNKSREEVVWEEAKQRARQAVNNDMALSMAASDDEFGAVKSFFAFMQKAEQNTKLNFSPASQKKVAKLGKEHARIKGLYEVAQDTENPAKAAGATKLLLEIGSKLIPTIVPKKPAEVKPVKAPIQEVKKPKKVVAVAQTEEEREAEVEAQKDIADTKAAMQVQMGGKDEKGNVIPAQMTQSGKRVTTLAQGPHIPQTKTGKSINLGLFGVPDELGAISVKDASGKPIHYINPDTNEPELDAKDGKPIPVVFDLPAYNAIDTSGHRRYHLNKHIGKLQSDSANIRAALKEFSITRETHPLPLQAESPSEIGGTKWQGFRNYADDISSRDAFDGPVSDATDAMESAMRVFNQTANNQGKRKVRNIDREHSRGQTTEEYVSSLYKALDTYDDAVRTLEDEYEKNDALKVKSEDSDMFRKTTFPPEQVAELSRLWFVQQYAKSQNMFTKDGEEITPFTDFLSRFRFAPEEFMPDKETGLVNGQEPDKHQLADAERVEKHGKDIEASVHWGKDNDALVQQLFTTIVHQYQTSLGKDNFLYHHLAPGIKQWAPNSGMVLSEKTGKYSSPATKKGVGKSKWVDGIDKAVTEKRKIYRESSKEVRRNRPAAQQKKREYGDVVKQKFVQTFKTLNKLQSSDPEEVESRTADPVVEAYPSMWKALNKEAEDAIQNTPGKDYEEQIENYMEARQEEILKNIENGLDDENHPVYELMNQMKLPGAYPLHRRLSATSDPDRVDLYVIQKEPEIVKRLEKIQKSNPYVLWDEKSDALYTAIEKLLVDEEGNPLPEASADDLLSPEVKERYAQSTPDTNMLNAGIEAYNFVQRHLHADNNGMGFVPEFNLGRVDVTHDDGKKGFKNVNYKIEAFGPDDFSTVEDILDKWWFPLVEATAGGAITNRIQAMGEWHEQFNNDFRLEIVKPKKREADEQLPQEEDVAAMEEGLGRAEGEYTEDELDALGEYVPTEDDEEDEEEEKPDDEQVEEDLLRKNLQKMYEAIQEDASLADEFCGTTQEGESTGTPAVFTLDANGVVEFHPDNFRLTNNDALKKLEGLLTDIGLENVEMNFTGSAKGLAYKQASKKITASSLGAIMKERFSDYERALLDEQAPGTRYTYKDILTQVMKLDKESRMGVEPFIKEIVTPLIEEAGAGSVGKYDMGEGEFSDALPPLSQDASFEERKSYNEQKRSALESINDSHAMKWLRHVGANNGLGHYESKDAEEIVPILFEAIRAGGLQRQQAFDEKYGTDFDDQGNAVEYADEAYDESGRLKIWEGLDIDEWISDSDEYGVFVGQLKQMFVDETGGTGRLRKDIDENVPPWADNIVRQFMQPNSFDEDDLFPDITLYDMGEDAETPPELINHVLHELNNIQGGLQSFNSVSPNASMLLNQQLMKARGDSSINWYYDPDNQVHIDQWKELFGQDVFTTWRGHRRILSFLGAVNKTIQESGGTMPKDFPAIFGAGNKIHPDIFNRLAEDILSIPQSTKEWEDFDEIPEHDKLLQKAVADNYNPEVLASILNHANLHAVPDYTGVRLSTRDETPSDRLSDNWVKLIGPMTDIAFERLGGGMAGGIKTGKMEGYESDELTAEILSGYSDQVREKFETKLIEQMYSSELSFPFAKKSLSHADDYVSKLVQTLQEEMDLIPEGSRLRSLVEMKDGTPGTLVSRINRIKKEYINSNVRDKYHQEYWDTMRGNKKLLPETRNALADKWEGMTLSYDDTVKMNTITSMSQALTSYGYDAPEEIAALSPDKRNEINNLREAMNALKDRISGINQSDFDIAANPNYLDNLQMGMEDTFTDAENEVPAFQNVHLMTSDLVGNAWTSFKENFPDLTIEKGDVVFPSAMMDYLKSEYELDEAGQPIPELDDKGNPVMENILDEDGEPTGKQEPVYKEKDARVDEDASGDPASPDYLKGMGSLAKKAFTSRHYGEYTNPMEKIQEREMFLREMEEQQAAITRRAEAVAPGIQDQPVSEEQGWADLKAQRQEIKSKKKQKTNKEIKDMVAAEDKAAADNPYPGYTAGEGVDEHPRTHADLMEKLIGFKLNRVIPINPDHPDHYPDVKPRLSADAHRHMLSAKLVTPYDDKQQWEYTEKGKQLMSRLPKAQGGEIYKREGILPVKWAEAISGSVKRHGDAFFNTIDAAPMETPQLPQPEVPEVPAVEEGGAEPIQSMMYKMAKRVRHDDESMHPTKENHDALFESLKKGIPGFTRNKFKAWIKEHGLLTKGDFVETPFIANADSNVRLGVSHHLDYRSIWPFDYDDDGVVSGAGGEASAYRGLLTVLMGAEQDWAQALEKATPEGETSAPAIFQAHIAAKQAVNNQWIEMLKKNIADTLDPEKHPNNHIYPNPDVPVNVDDIVANQYYHDTENHAEKHMNLLRGNVVRWLGDDGHHLESEDGKNYTIFPSKEEGESHADWVARRGEGTPLNLEGIADHLKAMPRFIKEDGAFDISKLGHRANRPDVLRDIRDLHRLEHPLVEDEEEIIDDEDEEDSDKVIASGGVEGQPAAVTTEEPVTEQPVREEPEPVQRELPKEGEQLPLEGFAGQPQPQEVKPTAPAGGLSFREQKIAQHLQDRGFSPKDAEEYIANLDDSESKKIFGQHLDEKLKSTPDTTPAMEGDKRQQYEQEIRDHAQEMHGTDIHDPSKFSEMNDKQLTDAFHQSHKDISTHRSKNAADEKQNFANDVVTRVPPLQPNATPDTIVDRARVLMSEYLHHRHSYDKPALAHFQAQMQDMQAKAAQAGVNWEDTLGTELEQFDGKEGRAMFGSPEHKAFVLQQMQEQQQQQQGQQEEQTEYDGSLDDRFAEASKHEDYHPGEFIKPMIRNDGSRTYVTHDYNSPFTGDQMSAYASNDPAVQDIMAGGDMDSFTDVDGNAVAGWHHPASGSTVHPHVFEKLRGEVKSLNRNSDINTGLYIPDGSRYTNLYDPAPDEEIPAEHSLGKGSFWMGQDGNLIRLDRQAEEFDAHPHNAQHDHAPHKIVSDWHTRRVKQHLQQAGEGAEEQFNRRVAPISIPQSPRAQQAYTASQTPPERPEKAVDRFRQRQEGLAPQPSFNPMDYMTNAEKKKQQVYAATEKLQLPALSGLARLVTREKPLDKYHTEQRQAYEKENKVNELYQKLRSGYYGVDYINAPEEAQKRNPYATPPDVFYGSTPDAQARAAYEREQMRPQQMQEGQPPVAQGAGQAPQARQVGFNPPSLNLPKHWETTE